MCFLSLLGLQPLDVLADMFPGGLLKIEDADMAGSRDLSSHVLPQTPSMQPPSWAPLSGTTDTPYYAGPQGSDIPISSPFQVAPIANLLDSWVMFRRQWRNRLHVDCWGQHDLVYQQ